MTWPILVLLQISFLYRSPFSTHQRTFVFVILKSILSIYFSICKCDLVNLYVWRCKIVWWYVCLCVCLWKFNKVQMFNSLSWPDFREQKWNNLHMTNTKIIVNGMMMMMLIMMLILMIIIMVVIMIIMIMMMVIMKIAI